MMAFLLLCWLLELLVVFLLLVFLQLLFLWIYEQYVTYCYFCISRECLCTCNKYWWIYNWFWKHVLEQHVWKKLPKYKDRFDAIFLWPPFHTINVNPTSSHVFNNLYNCPINITYVVDMKLVPTLALLSTIDSSWFSNFLFTFLFCKFFEVFFCCWWIVVKHVTMTNCCLNNNLFTITHAQ